MGGNGSGQERGSGLFPLKKYTSRNLSPSFYKMCKIQAPSPAGFVHTWYSPQFSWRAAPSAQALTQAHTMGVGGNGTGASAPFAGSLSI